MIKVYGSSDDLIEIEGDISEEFGADEGLLAFSDGTILRIKYDGVWRITTVCGGGSDLVHEMAPEDDDDDYSDVMTLTGVDIRWVVLGTEYARRK